MMFEAEAKLLERDTNALKFIVSHVAQWGYPPSVREVGSAINVGSASTAHEVVSRLVKRGWISVGAKRARTIRVTEDGMDVVREGAENA